MYRLTIRLTVALGLGILVLLTMPFAARAQSPDAVADLAARINRERVARGLVPYALNAQLTAAAQSHASDLARTGKFRTSEEGHVGSDGSSIFDRVARTSYGAYSWGRRLGENWAHYNDTARAFTEWMNSEPHRNNILHPLYREIGIGIAPTTEGGFLYIVDFGAQPNVLPFFINDIATETRSADVILTLSDEQVMPNGDGASNIGHPTEVQISNSSDFAGSKWQPYAAKINWTLTSGAGTKTVYVKYRDAKGRTATANDSIVLNLVATPSPSPTRTPSPSASATATITTLPTSTPSATPTQEATDTPTVVATSTPTMITATPSVTPSPNVVSASDTAMMFSSSASIAALGFAVVIVILLVILKDTLSS
jgi:hypothetical protein